MTAHYIVYKRTNHFGENFPEEKLFVMEFRRDNVISLYLAEKPQVAIVRALHHLNVNKSFVSPTIARYRDTGSVADVNEMDGRKQQHQQKWFEK